MASIGKCRWTAGGVTKDAWKVRYVDVAGASRSKQFAGKRAAQAFVRELAAEQLATEAPKTIAERRFGRRLQFISPNDRGFKTPSQRHRGVAYLVLKGLVIRKATGRWRNASEREREGRTRNPRPVQAVIMFTLVPRVKKPRPIDLSEPAALAEARFPANLDARWR